MKEREKLSVSECGKKQVQRAFGDASKPLFVLTSPNIRCSNRPSTKTKSTILEPEKQDLFACRIGLNETAIPLVQVSMCRTAGVRQNGKSYFPFS